jgi:hypothetical protein
MTAGFVVLIVALSLSPVPGCENRGTGVVDPDSTPPFLKTVTITPDSIPLTTLTPTNALYTVAVNVRADVKDPAGGGTVGAVIAQVLAPAGGDPLSESSLHEESSGAGSRVFSGQIQFTATKSDVGTYHVRVKVLDAQGVEGNLIDRSLKVTRINSPPVLSNLSAPDTVSLPSSGSLAIPMSVTATDSNGQGDIREVFFRSLDSSDPNRKIFLLDDGNSTNGDLVAGDGIYSVIISLSSTNERKTYRFAFQAIDTPGDTSATLLHLLTVK